MELNTEQRKRCRELKRQGYDVKDVAKIMRQELGGVIKYDDVRSCCAHITSSTPIVKQSETLSINKDGSKTKEKIITLKQGQELTPELLLSLHGFKDTEWSIRTAINNLYETQQKGGDILNLYQSKITVEPKKANEPTLEEIKSLFNDFESKYVPPTVKLKSNKRKCCAEVNISDLHLGKLAWHGETGEDYDFKIASKRFIDAINDIINRIKDKNIEKILFPVGNDFFHTDTTTTTTTKGTLQHTDVRWQKMYEVGVVLMVDAIEMLRTVAPVDAFYINSNHDSMLSYTLIHLLAAHFRNYKDVEIDTSATPRKYREYGNTLIGFSHGDDDKKTLPGLMQIEAREAWGRTLFREFHAAHLHKESVQVHEDSGIIQRRTSSLSGTDAWHNSMGFKGSVKKSQTFIYDKEKGLTDILNSVV